MNGPARDGMAVFFHEAMLSWSAPDGVFECAPSELLEVQMPHAEGPDRIANMRSILQRSPIAWMK